ncbi:protein kinase domain-containing protein [Chondromyces apiculatus]|uniref:Protein kinase domain-containing protein n=1 Tax=Chondromyces apiculatus DSM 436 TaxID=1192034 RepID=A0A017TCD7_9BACT|nr:protein kinase [Chondromyces apiculatus]EYF06291.1 Hypothetical protein CAP_2169 [Chondromyces apiculatus DSM 436]
MARDDLRRKAAELVAAGQVHEGAELLVAAGDHAGASLLLEEACDFSGAAREALAAAEPRRAVLLAALGGDDALVQRATAQMRETSPREILLHLGRDLLARGHARHAARLLDDLGEHLEAAEAYLAARASCEAAACFDRGGRPADGARALEAALRQHADDHPVRLALGQLLARHGRTEAAVRVLQQLPPDTPERDRALPLLARSLVALGLDDAARTVRDEARRRGVPDEPPEAPADVPTPPSPTPPSGAAPSSRSGASPGGVGQLLFGRYDAQREVAVTPHARVIEARDRVTGEPVAVKIFASVALGTGRDALLRFEREARALSQLRHPHVVELRGYHPEGPAMVLMWMTGGSLADRLRHEAVAPARAVEIASALLGALGEAHRLGILHRDVKPSNVLFDGVGAARLSDFGAAHLGDLSSTATAGAIGSFAYMSPEQRLGKPATLASDLFGVGAVLSELLTGEVLSAAEDGQLDLAPSTVNPDLSGAHDTVLAHLLASEPDARPESAFEARRLLLSLRWPTRLRPARPRRQSTRPSARPGAADGAADQRRLHDSTTLGDGRDAAARRHDRWLARDVLIVPLTADELARARAFARAAHPALPVVLRIDQAASEIWVAPPSGRALADDPAPLSPDHHARLAAALTALHAAGGAHGHVDPEHIYLHDGDVTLAYPRGTLPAHEGAPAAEHDLEGLRHLEGAKRDDRPFADGRPSR